MEVQLIEKILRDVPVNVYPVTIAKYLLNKKKINNFFESVLSGSKEDFKRYIIDPDKSKCSFCTNMTCRKHISIERVKHAVENEKVLKESNCFIYKNEIFTDPSEQWMAIVYCPHTKLIQNELTTAEIKKITLIVTPGLGKSPQNTIPFSCDALLREGYLKFWMNNTFSIIFNNKDLYLELNN